MIHNAARTFTAAWWSVQLPPGWQAVEDDQCVTLSANSVPGVLQISAARNEARFVTDEDLKELAAGWPAQQSQLCKISTDVYSGYFTEYLESGIWWKQWLLRAGHLMIYASYNSAEAVTAAEATSINAIVENIKPGSADRAGD